MELDPQVVRVIEAVRRIAPERYAEVGPERAREAFGRIAAARRRKYGQEPVKSVEDGAIDGPGGKLPVRVYTPEGEGPLPIVLFLHGGGWTIGDLESYDSQARRLCNAVGAVTVAVEYRLAPEHPYPAAFEDAVAALRWTAAHAEQLGGDPSRLGLFGDSAGGNLAAAASLWAREEGGPPVAAQCLVYPSVDSTKAYPSLEEFADAPLLDKETTLWFGANYFPDFARRFEPFASPLLAERHAGLPPTVVATASHDTIRDGGEAYARALADEGVAVWHRRYEGMTHGFFAQHIVVDAAARAVEEICAAFRTFLDGAEPA